MSPKVRNQDGGVVAPRTGRVYPANPRHTKWVCKCYDCALEVEGETRKDAIEAHIVHKRECDGNNAADSLDAN
jgi:hypothetical protein